jgi:prepilin-type N-terminal cleavage/methylation domain-containing protein
MFKQTSRYHFLFTRGFTLIELLVVIAIIGILSSVVLASLTTARAKGGNAAVKEQLADTRAQAELFYSNNGTYAGVCATTGTNVIGNLAVNASQDGSGNATTYKCYADANGWSLSTPLKVAEGTSTAWCADVNAKSEGISSSTYAALATTSPVTYCP